MGIKGESVLAKPVATGEQLRLARLTLEGNSSEDDPSNIQRLIKKVIETTRCTQAQAELALYDNDNDLVAAVGHILDNESAVESWTEQKTKKDKKKEDEERDQRDQYQRRPAQRGQSAARGRGGFVERGGRGGGRGASARGTSRGTSAVAASSASTNGRGRGGGAGGSFRGGDRGNYRSQHESSTQQDGGSAAPAKAIVDADIAEENTDWKSGPMVFKRSEEAAAEYTAPAPATAPSGSSSQPVPISFAAVAAAANRKEELRRQQKEAPPAPAVQPTPEYRYEEPAASNSFTAEASPVKDVFHSEPSVANPEPEVEEDEEPEPTTTTTSAALASSPVSSLQANDSWTKQLKNDLGMGMVDTTTSTSPARPPTVQQQQAQTTAPGSGVEFLANTSTSLNLHDYQFGFVDVPAVPEVPVAPPAPVVQQQPPQPPPMQQQQQQPMVAPQQQHIPTEALFAANRHVPAPTTSHTVKPSEFQQSSQLSNGDYSLKSSPPSSATHNSYGSRLSFADTSSISYAPPPSDRMSSGGVKPSAAAQSQQLNQHHQSQQQQQPQSHQQPMYPAQMPYNAYPYMNMYSPVTGIRDDQFTAATLMQHYPFGMINDLSAILPQNSMPQTGSTHPSAAPHRSDSHNLVDIGKYNAQSSRGDPQQTGNVAPPPGFANPSFPMQPNLTSLFMGQQYQQHYPNPFMLPNIGNGGRQMYPQEEDQRKAYDKMGQVGKQAQQAQQQAQQQQQQQAQATPPPHYHNNGYLNSMNNKKPYSWNS